jgi:SAM-dependent methyltransferase
MVGPARGFARDELQARYEVTTIQEDEWHAYTDGRTAQVVAGHLSRANLHGDWLLNAGAGIYEVNRGDWREVSLDLFMAPILGRDYAVCGSVENLPFADETFSATVCIGEVLAYCDPAATLREFHRVLKSSGLLICDFGNSRSLRQIVKDSFGRAAHIVTDEYNGSAERFWIYNPAYIMSLLEGFGFKIMAKYGTHTWSALGRRLGLPASKSLSIQRRLNWLPLPVEWADLVTLVAERA